MKNARRGTCYVCGHTRYSAIAKEMHFHSIPSLPSMQHIRDQWLDFLYLPKSSCWPEQLWKNITLCSLHFDEGVYNPRHKEQLRPLLKKRTVPSRNRPNGPGVYGDIFSQVPESTSSDHLQEPPVMDLCSSGTSENNDALDPLDEHQNQEDLSTQFTLNVERNELCRFCGKKIILLNPIFGDQSSDSTSSPVLSKINMYLPFKVKEEDPLPDHICSNCCDILNRWHEFYVTSVAVDTAFWKLFGKQTNMLAVNPHTSEVQRNAETQTEAIPPDPSELLIDKNSVVDETPAETITYEMRGNNESKSSLVQEDKSFEEEFDKSYHTYRHKSYKCRFCYELFRNSTDRRSHIAMCRQLSTICELCGHIVPCRKDLKRHIYNKHIHKPNIIHPKYVCDKCNRLFTTATKLAYHENIHAAEDRCAKYCCDLCGSVFMQEDYFYMHKRRHEMGKVKTVFRIEDFRHEVNTEGSGNCVVYTCPVCQEKFNDMLSLAIHVTEKKKLKCSLCHKIMPSEKRFFLHVCEEWTCHYCFKSFDQRIKLLVHERWHTGEKPLKCRKCDLTFRSYNSRRCHEMKHKPSFQCHYCEMSFRNKDVFQGHVSRHEGKEFLCPVCKKKFSCQRNVGRHLKAYHKDFKNVICISK